VQIETAQGRAALGGLVWEIGCVDLLLELDEERVVLYRVKPEYTECSHDGFLGHAFVEK